MADKEWKIVIHPYDDKLISVPSDQVIEEATDMRKTKDNITRLAICANACIGVSDQILEARIVERLMDIAKAFDTRSVGYVLDRLQEVNHIMKEQSK